jgi:ABC-type uncharacterized transport system fused permease/ATPase subunit
MQIHMARGVIDVITEPLLPSAQLLGEFPAGSGIGSGSGSTTSSDRAAKAATSGGELLFLRRFQALLALLRPYRALYLALLSVAEAVVVAEGGQLMCVAPLAHCCDGLSQQDDLAIVQPAAVGKVAGSFYRIVVDRQPSQLAAAMLHAAALYAVSTALHATSCWLTEGLSLRWRATLTQHLHCRYCERSRAYYFMQRRGETRGGHCGQQHACQPPAGHSLGQQQHNCEPLQQQLQQLELQRQQAQHVDNADQRIAADASELCECLAAVAQVATAVPFKVLYYRC